LKIVLIAVMLCLFSVAPANATSYTWTIKGGFTGSGTFITSDTPTAGDPTAFLVTSMTGTFAGSTVSLDPVGTLYSDNLFFKTGLHMDDAGWTFHAGTKDYNMFLSDGFDANGPTQNVLIGYPNIPGGRSKNVTFAATLAPTVAPVSEPATLSLVGLGVAAVGTLRRRKTA